MNSNGTYIEKKIAYILSYKSVIYVLLKFSVFLKLLKNLPKYLSQLFVAGVAVRSVLIVSDLIVLKRHWLWFRFFYFRRKTINIFNGAYIVKSKLRFQAIYRLHMFHWKNQRISRYDQKKLFLHFANPNYAAPKWPGKPSSRQWPCTLENWPV